MWIRIFFSLCRRRNENKSKDYQNDTVSHTNTDINEPGVTVSKGILSNLLSDLLERIQKGDIVALSGSIPKGAPEDTYYVWTKACRELGAKYTNRN